MILGNDMLVAPFQDKDKADAEKERLEKDHPFTTYRVELRYFADWNIPGISNG